MSEANLAELLEGCEKERLSFLIARDGFDAAKAWALRTARLYRSAVLKNVNNEELVFTTTEGRKYKLYHSQHCCESVTIEDIVGDLNDLVGAPLLNAEEVSYSSEEKLPQEVK